MLVHLDTDLGSNPDDVAALAYLLARPDVELTGITTVDDPGGQRAGYVAEVLRLAGRADVPVAAGAERSLTSGQPSGRPPSGPPYWPAVVPPVPGSGRRRAGPARGLGLGRRRRRRDRPGHDAGPARAADAGRAARRPRGADGRLGRTRRAAACRSGGRRTTGTSPATSWPPTEVRACSRPAHRRTARDDCAGAPARPRPAAAARRLAHSGGLMARQAAAYRDDRGQAGARARAHAGLPDDLANFHHDPLAAAVAAGWDGVTIERRPSCARWWASTVGWSGPGRTTPVPGGSSSSSASTDRRSPRTGSTRSRRGGWADDGSGPLPQGRMSNLMIGLLGAGRTEDLPAALEDLAQRLHHASGA